MQKKRKRKTFLFSLPYYERSITPLKTVNNNYRSFGTIPNTFLRLPYTFSVLSHCSSHLHIRNKGDGEKSLIEIPKKKHKLSLACFSTLLFLAFFEQKLAKMLQIISTKYTRDKKVKRRRREVRKSSLSIKFQHKTFLSILFLRCNKDATSNQNNTEKKLKTSSYLLNDEKNGRKFWQR